MPHLSRNGYSLFQNLFLELTIDCSLIRREFKLSFGGRFVIALGNLKYSRRVMAARINRCSVHTNMSSQRSLCGERALQLAFAIVYLRSARRELPRRAVLSRRLRPRVPFTWDASDRVNWQLSMKSSNLSCWLYVVALDTATRARSLRSAVIACVELNTVRNITLRKK